MMGQRGPRPTPTEQLRLRGSPRASRNTGEPQPPKERPPRPEWLSDEAAEAWDQLILRLEQMGVLSVVDGNAIARYVELWVEWQIALALVRKHGSIPWATGIGT